VLSYQKLDVYQYAIEFLALVAVIVSRLPRGYSFLADELKRAASRFPKTSLKALENPPRPIGQGICVPPEDQPWNAEQSLMPALS
jgi:hypothetical protein